jgi:AraC family transcriptional regulator of adaptative response / DNA-3-methyladenine glycosylase II
MKMLDESCGSRQDMDRLAGRLGYTSRHMRRAFTEAYHITPIQYQQTCRLLLAKNLLTDTDLSVLDVAMAAGFGSLRRFNDVFKGHYGLAPTVLRKQAAGKNRRDGEVTLCLGYRPPYLWKNMLRFLAGRAISGIETVIGDEYARTVRLEDAKGRPVYGWLRVGDRPNKNVLTVTVSETLLPVLPQVLARVRHLFDLSCDPDAVYETLQNMNDIRPGLCVMGTRLPGCFDAFETVVRAVLGQQITVKAASTLAARFADTCGTPIQTGIEGLSSVFPSSADVLALGASIEDTLGGIGIIRTRSRTIFELARALSQGSIELSLCVQPKDEVEKLKAIRGIGDWTAGYIAMRTMGETDVFLETDAGVRKALPGRASNELLALAEAWQPWRSYATINLWNSL